MQRKKKQLLKVFTAWAQPKIPPHSLNSVLIKNSNSIPQGFAFRPAVSVAPSLNKELATPDESAWFQSLPDTQTFSLYIKLALILNIPQNFLKQKTYAVRPDILVQQNSRHSLNSEILHFTFNVNPLRIF